MASASTARTPTKPKSGRQIGSQRKTPGPKFSKASLRLLTLARKNGTAAVAETVGVAPETVLRWILGDRRADPDSQAACWRKLRLPRDYWLELVDGADALELPEPEARPAPKVARRASRPKIARAA